MNASTERMVVRLRYMADQLESGKAMMKNGSVITEQGDPQMLSLKGAVWSMKFQFNLEIVPSGPGPLVAQGPSGEAPPVAADPITDFRNSEGAQQ